MPSLKAIRKRIASTKATQKITRAMKMVAGARLNRAQQRIVAMRPYAVKTGEVLASVASSMTAASLDGGAQTDLHPLLVRRQEKKVLFVVLSGDRGLCGAFNTNINKAAEREWKEKQAAGIDVHFMRDATRGGVATVLNEIAQAAGVAIDKHRDGTTGIYIHDPFGNAVELICYPAGQTAYDNAPVNDSNG